MVNDYLQMGIRQKGNDCFIGSPAHESIIHWGGVSHGVPPLLTMPFSIIIDIDVGESDIRR